jgi:hypothetical protein
LIIAPSSTSDDVHRARVSTPLRIDTTSISDVATRAGGENSLGAAALSTADDVYRASSSTSLVIAPSSTSDDNHRARSSTSLINAPLSTADNPKGARIAFLPKPTTTSTLDVVPSAYVPVIMGTANNAVVESLSPAPMSKAVLESLSPAQTPHSAPNVLVINDFIAPPQIPPRASFCPLGRRNQVSQSHAPFQSRSQSLAPIQSTSPFHAPPLRADSHGKQFLDK